MPPLSSLKNISYCRYRASSPPPPWSSDQFHARDIVRAVKGEDFGGFANLRIGDGLRRLDKDNMHVAFDWFAQAVLAESPFTPGTSYSICPIPNSTCTKSAGKLPRTIALANALADVFPALTVWDGLRFNKVMAKNRGGARASEQTILQNLVLVNKVPGHEICLVDDVCTQGNHARAAATFLLANRAKKVMSVSVARTMLNLDEDLFGAREDELVGTVGVLLNRAKN